MQQDFSSEYATWLLVSFIFHDTFPVRHGVMLRFCVWKVWWLWIRKRFIAFGHPRLSPGGSNLCMEINNSYVFYNWLWIKFIFMTGIHKIHEKSTQNWTHFDESNSQKSMWILIWICVNSSWMLWIPYGVDKLRRHDVFWKLSRRTHTHISFHVRNRHTSVTDYDYMISNWIAKHNNFGGTSNYIIT